MSGLSNKRDARKALRGGGRTLTRRRVQLGDGRGHLWRDYTADPTLVYYHEGELVAEIINVLAPPILELWVWIGKDPIDGIYQVIKVDANQSGGPSSPPVAGYAPASRYGYGGADPVYISIRQITDLRPSVNDGMLLHIAEGLVETPAGWLYFGAKTLNVASYIPTAPNTAAFVLVTIDSSGAIAVTDGADVSPLTDLVAVPSPDYLFSNIPAKPADTAKTVCAVRVYKTVDNIPQTAMAESLAYTDLVDLRFMDLVTGTAIALNIHGATAKTTPVDDDEFPGADSVAGWSLVKFTWANIVATLIDILDALYAAIGHSHSLDTEGVQDVIGAMVSGNTESGIVVTYQDGDGTLDFVVAASTLYEPLTNGDDSDPQLIFTPEGDVIMVPT